VDDGRVDSGTVDDGARQVETVDELLDRWLASRTDVREVTVRGYRDVLVPVRQRLGHRVVGDLEMEDVLDLARWMASHGGRYGRGLSPRTVEATLGAFAQAVELAVEADGLGCNVVRAAKAGLESPGRRPSRDTSPWSREELATFRSRALDDRYAAAWLLSLAGFRRAEVLGLHWGDVALENGTVRVERGRVSVGAEAVVGGPTHSVVRRTVPVGMLPGVVPALRAMRLRQSVERAAAGDAYAASDFVVVDEIGVPPRPWWYSERFQALSREAGVPVIPLDALRRLAADPWRAAGVPEACIAEWLGTGFGATPPRLRHRPAS